MAGHESILWHLLPYCVCLCVWAIILLIYESSFKGLHTINYAYISSKGILQFTHTTEPTRYIEYEIKWAHNSFRLQL